MWYSTVVSYVWSAINSFNWQHLKPRKGRRGFRIILGFRLVLEQIKGSISTTKTCASVNAYFCRDAKGSTVSRRPFHLKSKRNRILQMSFVASCLHALERKPHGPDGQATKSERRARCDCVDLTQVSKSHHSFEILRINANQDRTSHSLCVLITWRRCNQIVPIQHK